MIEELFAELGQSHVEIQGGDMPKLPPSNIGLLGIDLKWDPSRRLYRIDRIFRGQNWNPDMISPLTLPGMNVEAGDYLLAIDGTPLEERVNPDSLLVGKAGQTVELTIRGKSGEAGARTVKAVPASYSDRRGDLLRYTDWVLGNLEKVSLATGGKVGYIHIPDTYYPGMESFFRYFYPQIHKEGLIVDIRFNSGGYSPYWMVERLNRSMIYYSKMPYGKAPIKEPGSGLLRLKVCLTNEWAESGERISPRSFAFEKRAVDRQAKTSGNLASARDFYLMDRGIVTTRRKARKTPKAGTSSRTVGVVPDIEASTGRRTIWPGFGSAIGAMHSGRS